MSEAHAEAAQIRDGVTPGSWWVYTPPEVSKILLRVAGYTFLGCKEGSLELEPYVYYPGKNAQGEYIDRLDEVIQDLHRMTIVRFWQLVNEDRIARFVTSSEA